MVLSIATLPIASIAQKPKRTNNAAWKHAHATASELPKIPARLHSLQSCPSHRTSTAADEVLDALH
jgi:hypothetical protein